MGNISFLASLPPIQSAIKLDGQGGARIQLEVPEEDIMEVMKLAMLKGIVFKVTVNTG